MKTTKYIFDTLEGLHDLKHDIDEDDMYHATGRELVVVEADKATDDLMDFSREFAEHHNLAWQVYFIVGETGLLGKAYWIAQDNDTIHDAIRMVEECREGRVSRSQLQDYLGDRFGHNLAEIAEFKQSVTGRTCQCDLCGGEIAETKLQADARKARMLRFCG